MKGRLEFLLFPAHWCLLLHEVPEWQLVWVLKSSVPCYKINVWSGACHLGSGCAAVKSAQILKEGCYEGIKGRKPFCANLFWAACTHVWLLSSIARITVACSFPFLVRMEEGILMYPSIPSWCWLQTVSKVSWKLSKRCTRAAQCHTEEIPTVHRQQIVCEQQPYLV